MIEAQEVFFVLFSIMYGVMLQSLSGLSPFPLGRTLKGHVHRWGRVERRKDWNGRVIFSIFLLNVLPFAYLCIVLFLLNGKWICWNMLTPAVTLVGLIFWASLGVFGFYRFYHAAAVSKKLRDRFFSDIMEALEKRGVSFDATAHLIWGCIYVLPGPFCLWLYEVCELAWLPTVICIVIILFFLQRHYRIDPNNKPCQIHKSLGGQNT
jgi:hypothetical protein